MTKKRGVGPRNAGSHREPSIWTMARVEIVERGIEGGLSWADIAARLPGIGLDTIRRYASKYGLARRVPGEFPVPLEERKPALLEHDPLLVRLTELHPDRNYSGPEVA